MSAVEPSTGADVVEILAVDDNPNNLGSLEALLENASTRVVKAHSGDAALRYLLQNEVAIILLDIQMPGMDGFETATLIRARERTRHIPIIFLTAHSSDEAKVLRGYQLGAVDFLFKPIVTEILRAKVSVFLDLSRKTRQLKRHTELQQRLEHLEHERALKDVRRESQRQQQERVAETLTVLADAANELLFGPLDRPLLDRLHTRLANYLGLEIFMEHRMDGTGTRLCMTSSAGLAEADAAVFAEVELDASVMGVAAASHRKVVLHDVQTTSEPHAAACRALGMTSLACFPLVAGGSVLGTLTFGTRRPTPLGIDDERMMQGFCDQVGAALERDRLLEELRERDRRKDEFLAMLSHELRNPLAPVRTAIELIRTDNVPPALVERALGSADRQVKHMMRMLDDLLDVTRITKGKVELRRTRVALANVIDQAVQTTEKLLTTRNHRLQVSLPAEPIHLDADATRLVQVFANLLHNAAKYTDHGGDITLTVTLTADGPVVRITDSGIGIRRELLPRVFDLFVQGDATSDRAQGGLGLGLTMVHRLVIMHGGTVSAHSAGLGQGSEFIVRLPLSAVDASGWKDADSGPLANLTLRDIRPMDVLLIEDNVDVREMMRSMLELHGHRVGEAPDGLQGVALLLESQPDVAIIDIGLPGLDGYGVAEQVRRSPAVRTRLIAMTGYGRAEERERALKAGFDAHIVKPVSMHELVTLFRQLC